VEINDCYPNGEAPYGWAGYRDIQPDPHLLFSSLGGGEGGEVFTELFLQLASGKTAGSIATQQLVHIN
jgi:hypothetical protein